MRRDETGFSGPTRGQARGPHWVRCAPGLYVPALRPDVVEQRIVEQAGRLGVDGAVTAWAALRWRGAAFFDGRGRGGEGVEPVPLLVGSARGTRPHPGSTTSKARLPDDERELVAGVAVATPHRALFDEVVRRGEPWWAAEAIAMASAAGLVTADGFRDWVGASRSRPGLTAARRAAVLGRDDLVSPREVWMHLVWERVAGLPRALGNVAVFGLDDSLLGVVDLLDPVAGVVGEYDGAHHREEGQHRSDVDREERFRDHGLEYVTIVRGHRRATVADRFVAARARAAFAAPHDRRWTLATPWWWTPSR